LGGGNRKFWAKTRSLPPPSGIGPDYHNMLSLFPSRILLLHGVRIGYVPQGLRLKRPGVKTEDFLENCLFLRNFRTFSCEKILTSCKLISLRCSVFSTILMLPYLFMSRS